jgi:hypothetical protein
MEYFKAIYQRYRSSSKEQKSRILDEFCRVAHLNRKYAICKLNGPLQPPPRRPAKRGLTYSPEALKIVLDVWKRAGYPWSKRLKEVMDDWWPWIQRRYRPTQASAQEIRDISSRQIDRRLKSHRTRIKKRIYGRTKPGKMLKHHIAIRTTHWDIKGPGWIEVDLVAHSGNNGGGEFAYSVNLTDIHTGWVETRAVLGKGEERVVRALDEMLQIMPFRVFGLDSDNGSEFINAHLYHYCQEHKIEFTRGRPYCKEDNAHIEQKNWTHVRRLIGYERFDTPEAVQAMNGLYRGELRLMMNLFQPSVKLRRKERIGSRVRRQHDDPRTPLARLAASGTLYAQRAEQLRRTRLELDPFDLSDAIDRNLVYIQGHSNKKIWPRNPLPVKRMPATRFGFKRRDNFRPGLGFQMS